MYHPACSNEVLFFFWQSARTFSLLGVNCMVPAVSQNKGIGACVLVLLWPEELWGSVYNVKCCSLVPPQQVPFLSLCCSQDRTSSTVVLDMLKVANVEKHRSVTWGGRLKWSTPGTKTRVNRALRGRKCRCPTVILKYDESCVRQGASSKCRTASTFTCSALRPPAVSRNQKTPTDRHSLYHNVI